MANIKAFRGIHYNPAQIDLADVITPPYDVISPEQAEKLKARSPYNFAHVDLPRAEDPDYNESHALLTKWRETGTLVQDESPSFYVYEQSYRLGATKHRRQTLMAAVQLHEFSDAIIRPHENTFGKYKEDRLRLMARTQCNLSHIFAMVKDPEGFLASNFERFQFEAPVLSVRGDDGVEHNVWRIDAAKAPQIPAFFADKPLYIVDGHHRYESSVRYAKETGALGDPSKPAAYTLFAIANSYDPGLIVLPTHRRVRGLPEGTLSLENIESAFELMRVSYADLKRFLSKPPPIPSFGLYFGGDLFVCTPHGWKPAEATWGVALNKLSVAWSDRKLLGELCHIDDTNRAEHVSYEKDMDALFETRSDSSLVVFHAPPSIDSVMEVADEKSFMPQKSTYFYPKIAAGLVLRAFD